MEFIYAAMKRSMSGAPFEAFLRVTRDVSNNSGRILWVVYLPLMVCGVYKVRQEFSAVLSLPNSGHPTLFVAALAHLVHGGVSLGRFEATLPPKRDAASSKCGFGACPQSHLSIDKKDAVSIRKTSLFGFSTEGYTGRLTQSGENF
ncbi:hypothetical protein WA026_009912 [Henosepilachna vigintioctopunctata]|uniref:Uncharacterized protein n=1 Tax=Henosepilachna vigintioctopunctata TaxID=420089 RepID=A0AAW1TT43_9CUCU